KPQFPIFETSEGRSEDDELIYEAEKGLQWRLENYVFPNVTDEAEKARLEKEYKDRLQEELPIIIRMGFSSYFLVVADFIKWAKKNNIPVGPGRGSGAGSIIAWS